MPDSSAPNLAGTVKFYERHLFICAGVSDWEPRIEMGGGFAQALAGAIAQQASHIQHPVKLTACDLPPLGPPGSVDLLVFPDMVRYTGITESELPALIADHLVGNRVSDRLARLPLTGNFVFVCSHGARDERCGRCGPPVAARFREELAARGLLESAVVSQTSHVGGHAYAGNVLIYPGGDWYGLVTPADVPAIVEAALHGGQVVARLWRGRMGLLPEQQITPK